MALEKPDSREKLLDILQDDPFIVAEWYSQPGDGDICEPLVRALEDPDEIVRAATVGALVSLNDLYAASSILWMLLHGSVHARKAAAEVLGAIGRGNLLAIQYLTKALEDPDNTVRRAAARAFMRVGGTVEKI
jgi:HEAT repeat protein